MTRTRIKFCGIRRKQDAELAVDLGVDALGFVLVPRSKRYIDPGRAAVIRAGLPPFVTVVALFMDADAGEVQTAIDALRPDVVQFHGREDAAFCASFGLPYIKAVAMSGPTDLSRTARQFRSAQALLLDAHAPGAMGGSGKTFDWSCIKPVGLPLVLAGGLTADNVGRAVRTVRPYAVDVSSGIERRPGVKDPERMRAFVRAVRRADGARR
ncbi:phosphoribosylanthranilate isomerase [Fontimonas thermophila]|uniref:N-(5'-phosphoribosyl)anthranilate isomerase n=1 Tax=Fontimonas thermophila TaxID=1076937 RepID=A0A1I2HR90_9GAMM|nr:phosphoribosylanthranilate isomerase [Fontimonas thermophila]SFF31367.1 phosphoribosylanthranilate isomerase [Fontimonas thermophila]